MPEEAFCPTCKCNVVRTQQDTCPMGHPLDGSAQPPASAPAPAAGDAAAPPPIPGVDPAASAPAPDPTFAPPADEFGDAPVAGAAAAGAAGVAGVAAAGSAVDAPPPTGDPLVDAGQPDPRLESTLPPPEDSDFLAGADAAGAAPADSADPFAAPPMEGTEMAASAGDPKKRKVSPALIIVLLVVLFLAGAAAAVMLFAPGLIGLASLGIAIL